MMTLQEVYDYLLTRCNNFRVAYGFSHVNYFNDKLMMSDWDMARNVTIGNMIGNISHELASKGHLPMRWANKEQGTGIVTYEIVIMDDLEEMGATAN
jgi:hypothetical protein